MQRPKTGDLMRYIQKAPDFILVDQSLARRYRFRSLHLLRKWLNQEIRSWENGRPRGARLLAHRGKVSQVGRHPDETLLAVYWIDPDNKAISDKLKNEIELRCDLTFTRSNKREKNWTLRIAQQKEKLPVVIGRDLRMLPSRTAVVTGRELEKV